MLEAGRRLDKSAAARASITAHSTPFGANSCCNGRGPGRGAGGPRPSHAYRSRTHNTLARRIPYLDALDAERPHCDYLPAHTRTCAHVPTPHAVTHNAVTGTTGLVLLLPSTPRTPHVIVHGSYVRTC